MVHLLLATHTAGHQQVDLRQEIYCLTRIVQTLATAADLERLREDMTNYHIRVLQGVALHVVENPSQTAASSARSEMSEPLDPRARRRIDEWLNRDVSEGSLRTDLGSWDAHEGSTSPCAEFINTDTEKLIAGIALGRGGISDSASIL